LKPTKQFGSKHLNIETIKKLNRFFFRVKLTYIGMTSK